MADDPDYFEFLESVSDVISDVLLFATQSLGEAVILSYNQIDIAMQSLIAVGEEVRDKIEKEELKRVASKGVEDSKRTLAELNRACLEVRSSGVFDNKMRERMLFIGKEMLLGAVRVLKVADVFECLGVIKKLKLAVQTVDDFGNRACTPSDFNQLANFAISDCVDSCKGMRKREKIVQDLECREGLATQIGAVQKLSEPLVRVVDRDIKNPGMAETQSLRQRTTNQLLDCLNKGVEIVEISSVDLFADIETSFQLMGSGSYDHEASPAAEDVAQKIIEVSSGLKRMASSLRANDLQPLVAEVKKLAGAIKAMEVDIATIGVTPKHKKLLASLTPLVQDVKAVLADPSPEQKRGVEHRLEEVAKANDELYENLRSKLSKTRIEEMDKVVKPSIYSNKYMHVDPEKQILDPLQELKKEAAVLGDKTQDAKLYSNEQFRPNMLVSGDSLMEAADGLNDPLEPGRAVSVNMDPGVRDAQVYANQGMSPDGNRLDGATKDLLNAAASLEPEDCREIALGDMRIKSKIREGKVDEVAPLMEQQLLACKSLSAKGGSHTASLLEMANQLQNTLVDLKQGLYAPLAQYKKTDMKGLLDDLTENSKLSPVAKEAEWFRIMMEGEGKMDDQARQTFEIANELSDCFDVLLDTQDPEQMIQNGKKVAALSVNLSKLAKSYAQKTTRHNDKDLQAVADNLRNVATQLKILSCICASSGGDGGNDPVKHCVANLQGLVKKSLSEIQVSCI